MDVEKVIPMNPVSFDDIRKELGITGAVSLNDPKVRELAGRLSGEISLNDLRGKAASTAFTAFKFRFMGIQNSKVTCIEIFNAKHQLLFTSNEHSPVDIDISLSAKEFVYSIPDSYRESLKNNMAYIRLNHDSNANYYVQLYLVIGGKDVQVSDNLYAYGGLSISIPCVHP